MFSKISYKIYLKYLIFIMGMGLLAPNAIAERININEANAETLQYIPGIGPVKSQQIIQLREKIGSFENYQQLLEVPGIGEKMLELIQQRGSLDNGAAQLTPQMLEELNSKSVDNDS